MRELTFKSYLMRQMGELTGLKSSSLYRFAALSENNARLKDVLCLYLSLYVEGKLRNQLTKKYPYLSTSCRALVGKTPEQFDDSLSEYKTIYENYQNLVNKKINEDTIKLMLQKKIVEIQKKDGISNYRIYKTLNLNPGNVNAFLKNSDVSKLGLNTVRKILEFVKSFAKQKAYT